MKKKFVSKGGRLAIIMTLVSLMLLWQNVREAYAVTDRQEKEEETNETEAEEEKQSSEKRLMKKFILKTDETEEIPRYIVEDDTTYVLDEASIVVEESEKESSEGADVVKFSRKVEELSDNDLTRIAKTAVQDGMTGELLNVVYTVEEEDEKGIPIRYSALCEYGGLKKYSVSYPTTWEMTAWYELDETHRRGSVETIREEYVYVRIPAEREAEETVSGEPEGEETPLAKREIKEWTKELPPGNENKIKISNVAVSLAAAAAGGTLPFIIWFWILTIPVYALKKGEKYRYIGRARLKKADGMYTAYLTKRIATRTEIPVFMMRLPKKVRKKAGDMMQVCCPNGKRILLEIGKEINFTVEGD